MAVKRLAAMIATLVMAGSLVARADSYKVDSVHSATIFRIHHFNSGYVWGMIGGPTGTFEYDAADPTKLSFAVSASLDNLDTQNAHRDADLKGPDWFNAKQFPTIDFKSTAVTKTSDTTFDVTGDLTLHGVTKSIVVKMEMTGTGNGMRGDTRTGFEGNFTIHREDFDMNGMSGPVGDDVKITVALEGIKQQATVPTFGQIVQIFVLPALIVGIALLLAWWPPSRKRDGRWMGAIAMGGGFAVAACGIFGWPHWPPGAGDASYRLVWLALAVAVGGFSLPSTAGPLVFIYIVFGIHWWLAAPLHQKFDGMSAVWLYGQAVVATASWWILDRLSARVTARTISTLFVVEFAGWAAVLGMSDNVKISQAFAALAAMTIVATVLAIPLPLMFNRGAIWAWTALLYFLLAFVHLYSYTQPPMLSIILLVIAPLLVTVGDLPPAKRLKPRWRLAVRLLPAFLAVAAAVGITAQQFFSASADKIQTDSY